MYHDTQSKPCLNDLSPRDMSGVVCDVTSTLCIMQQSKDGIALAISNASTISTHLYKRNFQTDRPRTQNLPCILEPSLVLQTRCIVALPQRIRIRTDTLLF